MNAVDVLPAHALAHLPGGAEAWLASLSTDELAVLPWCSGVWLRPEQYIPAHHWRSFGLGGGRGWGKSYVIAVEINRRVLAGEEIHIGLMAPTEVRVDEVQIKSLIDYAPPWFKPVRTSRPEGLRWPNGVQALMFTPEAPGRPRSENISLSWLCEIVDWKEASRVEAFDNITTATRIGRAQFMWDSTSKGRNDLLDVLYGANAQDPEQHVIVLGEMFDNPLLSPAYMRSEWLKYKGVRRDEELRGKRFAESEGALWAQETLDRTRVDATPADVRTGIVAIDPATSTHSTADETGIIVALTGPNDHVYVTSDLTGKYAPEVWGDLAVAHADPRKGPQGGRITIERNKVGDMAVSVLRSRATNAGLLVTVIGRDEPWPARDERCIHVREQVSRETKDERAGGPAAETEAGRVHLVGDFPDLEKELTTYVPGTGQRSPNRYDALAFAVIELRGLKVGKGADGAADMRAAAEAQRVMSAELAARGARSGVITSYRPAARRGI